MSNNEESYPHQSPAPPAPPPVRQSRIALLVMLSLVLLTGGGAIGYAIGHNTGEEPATTAAPDEPADAAAVADEATPMHTPEPDVTGTKTAGQLDKAQVETSDRGLLIKDVGEPAIVGESAADAMAEFTIDEITVDPECGGEFAEPAKNGHLIMVTITATVQPGFTAWAEENGTFAFGLSFGSYAFGLIDADGVVVNEPDTWDAMSCLDDSEMMPNDVTDGQTATGKVVLDSPTPTGVLTYQPWMQGEGWEWEY